MECSPWLAQLALLYSSGPRSNTIHSGLGPPMLTLHNLPIRQYIFLNSILLYFTLCVWVFYVHGCLCKTCVPGTQKRASDLLELQLQALVSLWRHFLSWAWTLTYIKHQANNNKQTLTNQHTQHTSLYAVLSSSYSQTPGITFLMVATDFTSSLPIKPFCLKLTKIGFLYFANTDKYRCPILTTQRLCRHV